MNPTDEWGTPRWIIDFVQRTWGPLDLDVAAQAWNAKARRFISDGSTRRRWRCKHGWFQPPYSKPNLETFSKHLRHELLNHYAKGFSGMVPADTSTAWFRKQLVGTGSVVRHSEVLLDKYPPPFDFGLLVRTKELELELLFVGQRVEHVPHPKYRGPLESARFPSALFHFRRFGA